MRLVFIEEVVQDWWGNLLIGELICVVLLELFVGVVNVNFDFFAKTQMTTDLSL